MHALRNRWGFAAGTALVVALVLGGAAAAHNLPATPASSHASSTAITNAAGANLKGADESQEGDQTADATEAPDASHAPSPTSHPDNHGLLVSVAAQSSLKGGAQQTHGGYVSCVARGGINCTSSTPTFPSLGVHGASTNHSQASKHRQNG